MTERRFGSARSFEAIGTHWVVEFDPPAGADADELHERIQRRIARFDKDYSRFRADSLISRMARTAGNYILPDDAEPMFDLYHHLYEVSGGAVTPLIGQTLSDAGYDAAYSLHAKPLQPPPGWDEALEYCFPALVVRTPVLLDLGALGKGYLVDLIARILKDAGCDGYCINAGGDIRCGGAVQVALEHPGDATQAIGIASLESQSLCGSSGNRRAWGKFHHILDPRTLRSPMHIAGAWTVADSTMLADAMSTAIFFMDPERLREQFSFDFAIVAADGRLTKSAEFPAEFFV